MTISIVIGDNGHDIEYRYNLQALSVILASVYTNYQYEYYSTNFLI